MLRHQTQLRASFTRIIYSSHPITKIPTTTTTSLSLREYAPQRPRPKLQNPTILIWIGILFLIPAISTWAVGKFPCDPLNVSPCITWLCEARVRKADNKAKHQTEPNISMHSLHGRDNAVTQLTSWTISSPRKGVLRDAGLGTHRPECTPCARSGVRSQITKKNHRLNKHPCLFESIADPDPLRKWK